MECLLFLTVPSLKERYFAQHTQKNCVFELHAQSGEAPTVETLHAGNSMHARLVRDEGDHHVSDEGFSSAASIEDFLMRPVKIQTYTWTNSNPLNHSFTPWSDFLGNAALIKKLDNYHLVKGNLMLTFYVNGTPFHVGMILASYRYFDYENAWFTIGGDTQLVTYSQRPHLKLNVATNKSGCLCIPFYYPHNYLSLNSSVFPASLMGTVSLDSFANLGQINGTDSVTITVYAQMTDVKLTGPTVQNVALAGAGSLHDLFSLRAQSKVETKDEYEETGIISGPASTIAQYAGYLTEAPVIGPFALATQIGANAIGGMARLFGYSRPVNLADLAPVRPSAIANLALTEGADTSQKLSMTAKQEISVDPRLVGLPAVDEMSLKYLTHKESYLTKFTWDPSYTVGTTIFACDVNPMCERRTTVSGGMQLIPTSLSYVSRIFGQWCGSLRYRFEFITSNFHRGRLAVIYDPVGSIGATDVFNLTYNTIIDLEEGRDFTVEFKWQQDRVWLEVDNGNTITTFYRDAGSSPATLVGSPGFSNGAFFVQVVNELVVPDATTPIHAIVSISAGDDFMLQNPSDGMSNISPFVPIAQSGNGSLGDLFSLYAQASSAEITPVDENSPLPEEETKVLTVTKEVVSYVLERPLVCYGEVPTHLRQLLKRFCTARAFGTSGLSGNTRVNYNLKAMCLPAGWDPNGVDSALTGAGNSPYNFTGFNLINYLRLAYTGWRGSVRWKFVPNGATTSSITVIRQVGPTLTESSVNYRPAPGGTWTVAGNIQQKAANALINNGASNTGSAMTVSRTQAGLEVEIPYQLPLRFSRTTLNWHSGTNNSFANAYPGGPAFNMILWSSALEEEVVTSYIAAGEDFSLHGFIGAGVMYHSTRPTPNPV